MSYYDGGGGGTNGQLLGPCSLFDVPFLSDCGRGFWKERLIERVGLHTTRESLEQVVVVRSGGKE